MNRYRVHMHTAPSPGATYYSGHVDVWAEDEEQAAQRAKQDARRGAGHTALIVDRIEVLPSGSSRRVF